MDCKTLESIPSIISFKKMLRKKEYKNSTEISIKTAELYAEIIKTIWDQFRDISHLLEVLRELGKSFISMDNLQFSVGNIIKRILHIVREENNKFLNKLPEIEDEILELNKKNNRLRRITSLNLLANNSSERLNALKNSLKNKEENGGDNSFKTQSKMQKSIFNEYKDNILTNIEELVSELESISDVIKEQANDHINNNDVILTANHSDQLEDFLIEASQKKNFHVIIAESAPSLNGVVQAKNLSKKAKNIKITVIPDSAVFAVMPIVNKVFIGTRAIMANGGLISYNGVYNVCLCANNFNIPIIVVCGTFKLTPMYPFDHQTFNEFLSPDKIFKAEFKNDINMISFNTPAYDYVPPEFITIYLTNHGSQNPSYIYRLFSELYSQDDYFL